MSDDDDIAVNLIDDELEDDKEHSRENNIDNEEIEVEKLVEKVKTIEDNLELKKTKTVKKTTKKAKSENDEKVKVDAKNKQGIKKGPGRPRKIPRKEPIPRKGISEPYNSNNMVEMLYDMPLILKKIISFFKALSVSHIQVIFRKTEVIMYAVDHHKKNRIRICINVKNLNHYYCKMPFSIGLAEHDLENVLNKIDKDYTSVVIISDEENYQKNILIVLENDMQIDENHNINLVGKYEIMEREEEFLDDNYMLKFELPGRNFRKIIGDSKLISKTISFVQENKNAPLIFSHVSECKKIHSRYVTRNSEKIKLVSGLKEGESFRTSISLEYLKPISSSLIVEKITLYVDEHKNLMTKSYIDDGTIEICTLTDIIDQRKVGND